MLRSSFDSVLNHKYCQKLHEYAQKNYLKCAYAVA